MESRVKFLGHSVHPILIVFPLGLLATAVVFDMIGLLAARPQFSVVAYWMLISGIIGGLLAAVFGWLDWTKIPKDSRAYKIGLIHGLANTVGLAVFAASAYLRNDNPENPAMSATILSSAGAVIALFGGWLGGELVERLGVGVHTGANVNAPNSLLVPEINRPAK